MSAALVLMLAVFAAACWVCGSPVRLAAAGGVLLAVHPAPVMVLTAAAAVTLMAFAAVTAYRTLRADGWHLVTVQRPDLAPGGGVAP